MANWPTTSRSVDLLKPSDPGIMPAGSAFSTLQTSGRMTPDMATHVPFEEQSYARTTIKETNATRKKAHGVTQT